MDLITLIVICLGVLSSAAVFESFQQVFQNQKARKKLIEKLVEKKEKLDIEEKLDILLTKKQNQQIQETLKLIDESVKELNPSEQKHIREGLNQLSLRSKTNYIIKLLKETIKTKKLT